MKSRALFLFAALMACGGGSDATDGADPCGDPDGDGGDTGDVPNLLGNWTATIGQVVFDGTCQGTDVSRDTLDFLKQPIMLEGSPTNLRLTFADDSNLVLRGTASPTGAIAASGIITAAGADLHTAVGGMVYYDASDRVRWEGGAFVGVDLNADGIFDCDYRFDWAARKSGI